MFEDCQNLPLYHQTVSLKTCLSSNDESATNIYIYHFVLKEQRSVCHSAKCSTSNLFSNYFLTFLKWDFLRQGRFLHLEQQQRQQRQSKSNDCELCDFSLHNFSNEMKPLKNSDDVRIQIKVEDC